MAPPRQRAAALADDSRSEASSGTREYRATAPKSRKTGAAKEKAAITSAPVNAEQEEQPRVPWSDLPLDILHAYRHIHKLPTPSAFSNDYSRILLSQGIGLRSPTALAARRANRDRQSTADPHRPIGQDRVSKDAFALVVRKHFNSAGLSEQESIARFLYTVREERRGRQFRLRFQP